MKSFVWKYFTKINKTSAECKLESCNHKRISINGGSTKGLIWHLKLIHEIINDEAENSTEPCAKKQKIIEDFIKFPSINETISRLICVDNLNFHQIANSEYLRKSLLKDFGENIPKNSSGIQKRFILFYDIVKQNVITKISQIKQNGVKFSGTIDEWTSGANRRYVNINIHFVNQSQTNHINLGLFRMEGSWPAQKLNENFERFLNTFSIDAKNDIIGVTGDGASVMVKFGDLSNFFYQKCYNHAIHLSVCDIIFKENSEFNQVFRKAIIEDSNENIDDESEFEDESKNENEEDDLNDDSDADLFNSHMNIITKMRAVVKMFRRSPLKNDILQRIVKRQYNKELMLILDCSTRWNSVFESGKRFLKIIDCIILALNHKDIKKPEMWNDFDTNLLEQLLKVLEPIKLASEALSSNSNNLLIAEGTINFLLDELQLQENAFSSLFYNSLLRRISERRNDLLVHLLLYLKDGNQLASDKHFKSFSKSSIQKYGIELLQKYFKNISLDHNLDVSHDQITYNLEISLAEKLKQSVAEYSMVQSSNDITPNNFKKEFQLYERTKIRSPLLEQLYQSLMTIQPTSTQCERNFSVSNNVLSRNRRKMNDKTLSSICFLKSFFNEN
ncbi:hypothetical protein PVAND_002299 [Polypedilum vanderplanki]|uniref:HAT C-terminal dimerisation domain-containing protein n=1 Tax=Polypedilum vanderplanki TaxID=319348 RepID=A0A9J6BQX0_POLVA|nr:hypothetical protein PVAND_002299 [Polypedilum vanderplanki]